jgi:hypothetical protein
MVIVTIQVADARRTTTRGKRAKPVNLYGIDSSPSVKDDRPPRRVRNNDWGGSHCEASRAGSRVSKEAAEESEDEYSSGGFIVIHFLFTYNRISSLH